MSSKIIQYVFVRNYTKKCGALIAQACHAVTKATITYFGREETQKYLESINEMTKVILKLNEDQIDSLHILLSKNDIPFVDWIEEPENILTAVATAPIRNENMKEIFKDYKLF